MDSGWDLETAGAAPWTFLGAEGLHPNGSNQAEEHWVIRRWVADELTGTTPLAISWNTRKENLGGGNGVTGLLYRNGVKIDSAVIVGRNKDPAIGSPRHGWHCRINPHPIQRPVRAIAMVAIHASRR